MDWKSMKSHLDMMSLYIHRSKKQRIVIWQNLWLLRLWWIVQPHLHLSLIREDIFLSDYVTKPHLELHNVCNSFQVTRVHQITMKFKSLQNRKKNRLHCRLSLVKQEFCMVSTAVLVTRNLLQISNFVVATILQQFKAFLSFIGIKNTPFSLLDNEFCCN